jgi:hypothetical protein
MAAAMAANRGGSGSGLPRHPAPPSSGAPSHFRSASASAYNRRGSGSGDAASVTSGSITANVPREALLRLGELRAREQGLFGRAGFSDAQVTADPRFRLNAALRSSGLGGSSYAQQMMVRAGDGLRGAEAARRQLATFSLS